MVRAADAGHVEPTAVTGQAPAVSPFQHALQQHRAGRIAEAAALYRRVVQLTPRHAWALTNLALLVRERGDLAEALRLLRWAAAATPDDPQIRLALARTLDRLGRMADATVQFRCAIALDPANGAPLRALGVQLDGLGRHDDAAGLYRLLLRLSPDDDEIRLRLITVLAMAHRPGKAQQELSLLRPERQAGNPEYHAAVGAVRLEQSRNDEAAMAFRRALVLEPGQARFHLALGLSRQMAGDLSGAIHAYRRTLKLDPAHRVAGSNLVVARDFDPSASMADIGLERREWARRQGRNPDDGRPHANLPDPDRRLRIGYVSTYFCTSSGAMIYGSIIAAHDPAAVEVFCYSTAAWTDATTTRIRAAAHHWIDCRGLSDGEVAARIRADAIDILVDVDGHSPYNRLPVFAFKPAPLQVTAWGHAGGTGLDTVDYFFVDAVSVRSDEHRHFVEKPYDLPCVLAIEPPPEAPPVSPPPVLTRGHITFGCFNRMAKVSSSVLRVWAEIMHRVPDSRLLLKGRMLDDRTLRHRLESEMLSLGIATGRLDLRGATSHETHLAMHAEADIALDPFPLGGGVTTIEALWMGLPVVTLLGDGIFGRPTAAVLASAGLGELVASDLDGYVSLAAMLAADPARLRDYRQSLRQKLSSAPVANIGLYTRAVEAAYRQIWREWCDRATAVG